MDEIDFTISLMLMANSRMPYRELAEMLDMSVNSVHKRVKSLVEIGAIKNFQTKLSFLLFPNMVNVIMFGESPIKNDKNLFNKFGRNECIYNVTLASGNIYFIHAYIKNINELDSLVSFVRKTGKINELFIGLDKGAHSSNEGGSNDMNISKLDYLIIYSLKNNSRKTIAEVSKEINASTKTIRRHLNILIEKNLVRFTIDWYPDKTPQLVSMFILKIKPNIHFDDIQLNNNLQNQYGQKVVFLWAFSNHPNLIMLCVRTDTMKEIQDIQASLFLMEFESINIHILIEGRMYPTWLDTYLDNKVNFFTNDSK
ncbi:MAG: winged helix-turn-helix transcriptional regulator [Promethearchaeota archaeon]